MTQDNEKREHQYPSLSPICPDCGSSRLLSKEQLDEDGVTVPSEQITSLGAFQSISVLPLYKVITIYYLDACAECMRLRVTRIDKHKQIIGLEVTPPASGGPMGRDN